jgi:hypothetical protein
MVRGITVSRPFNLNQILNSGDADRGMTLEIPFNPTQGLYNLDHNMPLQKCLMRFNLG